MQIQLLARIIILPRICTIQPHIYTYAYAVRGSITRHRSPVRRSSAPPALSTYSLLAGTHSRVMRPSFIGQFPVPCRGTCITAYAVILLLVLVLYLRVRIQCCWWKVEEVDDLLKGWRYVRRSRCTVFSWYWGATTGAEKSTPGKVGAKGLACVSEIEIDLRSVVGMYVCMYVIIVLYCCMGVCITSQLSSTSKLTVCIL